MQNRKPEYRIMHLGINCPNEAAALSGAREFSNMFQLDFTQKTASAFTDGMMLEWLFQPGPGEHGHIAVGTTDIEASISELREKGIEAVPGSEIIRDGKLLGIYVDAEFHGFAVHLIQI